MGRSNQPTTRREFAKIWPAFREWLGTRGAEVVAATNPYEVARFTTPEGVGVVYVSGADRITSWMGGADLAYAAYLTGDAHWRVGQRTKRRGKLHQVWLTLVERDGSACIYCDEPLTQETATVDHIVPVTAGGPDKIINKVLACSICNAAGGAARRPRR